MPPRFHRRHWQRKNAASCSDVRWGRSARAAAGSSRLSSLGDPANYRDLGAELGIAVGSIGPTRRRCMRKLLPHLVAAGLAPDSVCADVSTEHPRGLQERGASCAPTRPPVKRHPADVPDRCPGGRPRRPRCVPSEPGCAGISPGSHRHRAGPQGAAPLSAPRASPCLCPLRQAAAPPHAAGGDLGLRLMGGPSRCGPNHADAAPAELHVSPRECGHRAGLRGRGQHLHRGCCGHK